MESFDFRKGLVTEIKFRLKMIRIIGKIVDSDLSASSKAAVLYKFYDGSNSFKANCSLFLNTYDLGIFISMEDLEQYQKIYNFYCECEKRELLKKHNNIKIDSDYAKFIIISYLNFPKHYLLFNFFVDMHITEKMFKDCVALVQKSDLDLYNAYEAKRKEEEEFRKETEKTNIYDIYEAIKMGVFKDGSKLDLFNVIKRLPLQEKYISASGRYSISRIESYLLKYDKEVVNTILKYLRKHYILSGKKAFHVTDMEYLNEFAIVINDREVNMEDNFLVLDYLRKNNLPFIDIVFNGIRRQYINGEIDLGDGSKKKKKFLRVLKEDSSEV